MSTSYIVDRVIKLMGDFHRMHILHLVVLLPKLCLKKNLGIDRKQIRTYQPIVRM